MQDKVAQFASPSTCCYEDFLSVPIDSLNTVKAKKRPLLLYIYIYVDFCFYIQLKITGTNNTFPDYVSPIYKNKTSSVRYHENSKKIDTYLFKDQTTPNCTS